MRAYAPLAAGTAPAELAGRILDVIEARPEAFDMTHWFASSAQPYLEPEDRPACGTTMCIAGWAAHLTGWVLWRDSGIAIKGGQEPDVECIAQDALGLTDDQVAVFYGSADDALQFLRGLAGR